MKVEIIGIRCMNLNEFDRPSGLTLGPWTKVGGVLGAWGGRSQLLDEFPQPLGIRFSSNLRFFS